MAGTLFITATPIGNLEDVSLRALRVLREADFIAAEDTRHTLRLLNHYGIKTPLTSLHEHNERAKAAAVLERLKNGESCALVSDAGTPLISDPGETLVRLCLEVGVPVTACPGASAAVAALALSGLSARRFCFEGFLPADKKPRAAALAAIAKETRTCVVYEAPHRIAALLRELEEILGGRKICAARELTKIHEECVRGTARELLARFAENEPRGEFVIVIEGRGEEKPDFSGLSVAAHVEGYIGRGLSESDAMKAAAKDRGVAKREIYREYKLGESVNV